VPGDLDPADAAEREALARRIDDLRKAARQELAARIEAAVAPGHNDLAGLIAGLGGEVTHRVSVSSVLGARIPADRIAALAADARVAHVGVNHAGEPELDTSAGSIGAGTFWGGGVTGATWDAGVLDTGVFQAHPAFAGKRFFSNMGTTDTGTHGTAMAGIFASTNGTNRGISYGCDAIVVARAGNDATSMAGMAYIASTGEPEACNYSFGNGTASTVDYSPIDQFFDGVVWNFNYMVSKSTGNNGFGTGAPTITFPAPAFNLMAVANVDNTGDTNRANDRINTSSSRGPTAGGRKKPDIAAPGTSIMTTNTSSGFTAVTGTSPAAPHIGASILLMAELGVTDVTAAKAVLINTADAMDDRATSATTDDVFVPGSLWNRRYGWGYVNLTRAHARGLNVFTDSIPDRPENADYRLYVGRMFQNDKATLAWERSVGHNGSTYPTRVESLSDLDLRSYRLADGSAFASSSSAIDNVEQFGAVAPAGGEMVVIKVEAFGSFDPDVATEAFALATTEPFSRAVPPTVTPVLSAPARVAPGAQFTLSATIANAGQVPAFGVTAQLSGMGVAAGSNPAAVGVAPVGESAPVSWTLQAPAIQGVYRVVVDAGSTSYGESFAGSAFLDILVGADCTADVNADGNTDQDDVTYLANVVSGGGNPLGIDPDFNRDGAIDQDDVTALIHVVAGGPCP
jgi:serine protease AprX